jgi:hypothetical protein
VNLPQRFQPIPWEPNLPFDWSTGGCQLSEDELKILRRLVREEHDAA